MKVQLVYFDGCPNIAPARQVLRRALAACALSTVSFEEVDVTARGTPAHLADWGSPTILVDGKDVAGAARPMGPCCRLYPAEDGRLGGVPSETSIRAALLGRRDGGGGGRHGPGA